MKFNIIYIGSLKGNYIGPDISGTSGFPQGYGIWVEYAYYVYIGGTDPSERNVIVQSSAGIVIHNLFSSPSYVTIRANFKGVMADGTNPGHWIDNEKAVTRLELLEETLAIYGRIQELWDCRPLM